MTGLPMLLGLLFVALKLTGYIAWSWIWVTAPFWFGLALLGVILVVTMLSAGGVLGLRAVHRRLLRG